MRQFWWLWIGLLLWGSAPARAEEVMTCEAVARLKNVLDVAVSPKGNLLAYRVSNPRLPGTPKFEDGGAYTELFLWDGRRSRPFVTGRVNLSAVHFTPDGSALTFLAKRAGDDHTSLYLLPVDGGEARRVLTFATDLRAYSLARDGRRVAFLAQEPLAKETEAERKQGFTQQIYEEDWRATRVYLTNLDADTSALKPLPLEGSASDLHFSPDGQTLAVALAPNPGIDADLMYRRIHLIGVDGQDRRNLENPGKLGAFSFSPDGRHLAVLSGADINDPSAGRLMVAELPSGKLRDLLPGLKGDVIRANWLSPGRLSLITSDGVYTKVQEVGLDGSLKLISGPNGPVFTGLASAGGTTALVGQTASYPSELFVLKGGRPERLTDVNPWLKNIALAKQEVLTYTARDGLEIQGMLIHPLHEVAGQRYPLILYVHGGPEAHEVNGWLTGYSMPGQVAAARGIAVFYPNYRGSTGRGVEFSKLSQGDPAGKEFDDLVDGVDALVKLGLVDGKKVGITGGSYGGYASAWGATYYSDRFAAAVMFVGISDKLSKTGTTDIPQEEFLVHARRRPWDNWNLYLERSPIRHVQKSHTPTLIMHGKDDPRVHPSQSLELYRFLKLIDQAPVRLVWYPGEGHGNRRSASRYDYNLRLMQWMEHYLLGPGGPAPDWKLDYPLKDSKS